MTDIDLVAGDSRDIQLAITAGDDDDTPISISNSVLRFAVRRSYNADETLILKTTYDDDEIEITDGPGGVALLKLRVPDTIDLDPGRYRWDCDLTRGGSSKTTAGTWAATAGSEYLVGTGVDFDAVAEGDLVVLPSPNAGRYAIEEVDEDNSRVRIEFDGWVTNAAMTHSILEGDRKTPAGFSGTFEVCPGVVR